MQKGFRFNDSYGIDKGTAFIYCRLNDNSFIILTTANNFMKFVPKDQYTKEQIEQLYSLDKEDLEKYGGLMKTKYNSHYFYL